MSRWTMLLGTVVLTFACTANDAILSSVGKGVGVTAEEALKDSFRDAVERAVGVFVDAEQQAQNDQVIRDSVLTHSNAYIEKYKRVSERTLENGLWEVKIVADVKKGELTRKLRDVMPEKTFSLVKRVDRKRYTRSRERLDEVEVAQDEVALRGDAEPDAAALKFLK